MNNDLRKVAVVGAAGFVGQALCHRLRATGWQVHGVANSRNAFLLDHLGIPAASGRYPAVLNLAYPTSVTPVRRQAENQEILQQLEDLLLPGGLLVHASTLAVFGFNLDRPIAAGPLGWRPDEDYVETKVRMEHGVSEAFGGAHQVEIVRLGNVWGAGSANWLSGLAGRIRGGLPVLVRGGRCSNATEVLNVADYFTFLAGRNSGRFTGTRYHHLAEFSAEPWSTFAGMIARVMGMELTETDAPAPRSLRSLIVGTYVGETYKFLSHRRVAGSVMRQIMSRLPASLVGGLRRSKKGLGPAHGEDETYYTVIGCARQFAAETVPGWQPPVTLEASLAGAADWLRHAGFVSATGPWAEGQSRHVSAPASP